LLLSRRPLCGLPGIFLSWWGTKTTRARLEAGDE
jgi:hypothetical protein